MGARVATFVLTLALAGTAGAAPVLEYQSALHGDPPLKQPSAVTIDPASLSICVTDEASGSLDVFDAQGFHRFRTDATSGMSSPRGGCIDAEGNFVFTDVVRPSSRTRTIRRLNFLGEPVAFEVESPKERWAPHSLGLTRNGDYLTVDDTGLLARHDEAGALLWTAQLAEIEWEGVDLLGPPVERPDGTILIPGATLGRVIRVSADGREKSGFGVPGTKRGELAFPVSVTVGPEGHILVVDRMRHKILVYDAEYNFLDEFGRLGYRPGEIYFPLAIAAAPDGRVFLSQGFQGRVQVYRLFDTKTLEFPEQD